MSWEYRRGGTVPLGNRRLVLGCAVVMLVASCTSADPGQPTVASMTIATTLPPAVTSSTSTTSTSTTSITATSAATSSTTTTIPFAINGTIQAIEDAIARDGYSGVVLIAEDGEVVWEIALGWEDSESGIANHMGTIFNLGSMNKMFTAVGIVQLMERGALRLDGTIAEYLPDYPNPEVAEQVTIEQLLTHTSGLGDCFTGEFEDDPHRFRTNADYLPLFAAEPLMFEPGTGFAYSNAGFVVLGLIIERVSDVAYDEYMQVNVFDPSGMFDTGAYDVEGEVADLAIGYTTRDMQGNETGVLAPHTALMPGRGFAAGGGYSTAGDLLRFRNALFGGELVSPTSLGLLIEGKVDINEQSRYGYGFFDRVQSGERVVGHGGGAPGVCSYLDMYPESGYTVVVLSNSDSGCLVVLSVLADDPPR